MHDGQAFTQDKAVSHAGRVPQLLKRGDVVPADITGSQLAVWKHFRQVEVIKDNPQSKPPDHGKSWAK